MLLHVWFGRSHISLTCILITVKCSLCSELVNHNGPFTNRTFLLDSPICIVKDLSHT
jgi:hypothetical protein